MTITTCQKVTLISCSVLCVSLFLPRMFLPRGKKEMGQPGVGPGFYPPLMHQLPLPEDPGQWAVDPSYSVIHGAEAKAKAKGIGRGRKYNLMAQVIPIYGFGIFLYIFYIIYKLTCRGKNSKSVNYSTVPKANTDSKIKADCELAKLQERLLKTEMMMERIVSKKSQGSGSGRKRKSRNTSKKEEKLLRQLRQITLLIQENRLEGASPEMEAEEVPYGADWEGYPEETYPMYHDTFTRPRFHTIMLEELSHQPTAEALAERMEQEEEEIMARKLSIVKEEDEEEEERSDREEEDKHKEEEGEDVDGETEEEDQEAEEEEVAEAEKRHLLHSFQQENQEERIGLLEMSKELECYNGRKKQISFSDHRDVFRYPKEDMYEEEEEEKADEVEEEDDSTELEEDIDEDESTELEEEADEDDPVMEAESLMFSCEGCPNPEEEAEQHDEEYLFLSAPEEDEGGIHTDMPKDVQSSGLRMRNRRET